MHKCSQSNVILVTQGRQDRMGMNWPKMAIKSTYLDQPGAKDQPNGCPLLQRVKEGNPEKRKLFLCFVFESNNRAYDIAANLYNLDENPQPWLFEVPRWEKLLA